MRLTNLRKKLRKARILRQVKEKSLLILMIGILSVSVITTGEIVKEHIGENTCEYDDMILMSGIPNLYSTTLNTGGAHQAINDTPALSIQDVEKDMTTQAPLPEEEEVVDPYEGLATEYTLDKTGYVTATKLNVRSLPSTDSNIIGHVFWYQEIMYTESEFEGWYAIKTEDGYGYISARYISSNVPDEGKYYSVSGDNYKRKSYMDYRTITSKTSRQWKLQYGYAYTGEYGIRMVNDRYCIALGQYYTNVSGTYVDVYLKNGEILKCILSDSKQWRHTQFCLGMIGADGGAVEFVVDKPHLPQDARSMGSISYANKDLFMSEVIGIRVYNKNILD